MPDMAQLVDGTLLYKWSCALMQCLNMPHPQAYLWNGLGVDPTSTVLTWYCLPFPESLFAIEFNTSARTVRAGVTSVSLADICHEDDSDTLLESSDLHLRFSLGDKEVLKRLLWKAQEAKSTQGIDENTTDSSASAQLERIRAYLLSLPGATGGCAQ